MKTTRKKPDATAAVLEKIAEMPPPFRAMGERLHAVIMKAAPDLQPMLFYSMPWYAKDGKRVVFFRADRLMTFGVTEDAGRDAEGDVPHLEPSSWFITKLDAATEARITAIVKRAVT